MGVWLLIALGLALAAALASVVIGDRWPSAWISAGAAVGAFAASLVAVFAYHASVAHHALDNVFYVDGLSGVFLVAVTFVYAVVAIYSVGYLRPGIGHIRLRRVYWPLLNVFGLALIATPIVANLGLLWVAVELTTVVSALLVTSEGSDQSLEAGWKYIVIGSAGLALGLLGIVVFYAAGVPVLGDNYTPTYTTLVGGRTSEPGIGPRRVRVRPRRLRHQGRAGADARVATRRSLGGTESGQRNAVGGVARRGAVRHPADCRNRPNHRRPDLHPCASSGVWRAVAVARRLLRLAPEQLQASACVLIDRAHGHRRSGIGIGGPIAAYGAFFHVIVHAAGKTLAFFGAGGLPSRYESREVDDVRGVIHSAPFTGAMVLIGALAIAGRRRLASSVPNC